MTATPSTSATIATSALFRSDSLVYGLMWGSKEAYMTTVGAEAVDSNRPLVYNFSDLTL